ncbi:mechanosensitive ion channel [Lacimicrobium sp. SS2-24]|uniref:mechanosensitive ion channel family protein n=1 Tax=Lacimicrobium sp. SS2-24 TaxID=2005569 RepID=UPI000B4C180C|nr:mechanosensitive ion channel [Lacimicrobium sp. SS2-24]
MTSESPSGNWQTALTQLYSGLSEQLWAYLPQLLGALLLVLAGWLVAWLLSRLTRSVINLINRLLGALKPLSMRSKALYIKPAHGRIAGRIVFWIVMLFFLAAATSTLGLAFFANWLGQFLTYLPRLLAGLLIMIGGVVLGNLLSSMTKATAESAKLPKVMWLAAMVKYAVIFTALVIGVEQLGINIQFITNLVVVVIAVFSAGLALAFALGSQSLVANLVGTRQARKHCKLQDYIQIGDTQGVLLEITDNMLILETEQGRTLIPGKQWMNRSSCVLKRRQPEPSSAAQS